MPNNKTRPRRSHAHFDEHDDRMSGLSEGIRRVSFKSYRKSHNNVRQHERDEKMRLAFQIDEDIDMLGSSSSSNSRIGYRGGFVRTANHTRGRGGRGYYPSSMEHVRHIQGTEFRKLPDAGSYWYKVTIPKISKHNPNEILNALATFVLPNVLEPYGLKKLSDHIQFYVDDLKVAKQLVFAQRKVVLSDNFKVATIVRGCIPQIEITPSLKVLMKLAMSARYNAVNKALDLSKFHAVPELKKEHIFCPLNRSNVIVAALNIIGESIPDVLALNLSGNHLFHIDALKILKTCAPNLKVLHIGNNKIRAFNQFNSIQGLPLEELDLDGNPLCDKFTDKDVYIRDIQKLFPKVIKLDGADVPRCIRFDVDDVPLLPSQGSFLCNPAAGEIVFQFLQQFYTLYDSNSRAPLLDAYHVKAQFALSCSQPTSSTMNLTPYLQYNNSLPGINNDEKRRRVLKQGRDSIIQYLTSLPQTQHDPKSLLIDCPVFGPTIIMFSVTGVFRDVSDKSSLRSFHRSFLIVPVGSGFCITNDMLNIAQATPEQVKSTFQETPAAIPATVVASTSTVVAPPVITPTEVDIATKQQMVTTLAAQSGMNLSWSEKCLAENGWDFNKAGFVFSELNKTGKIPAEAFIK